MNKSSFTFTGICKARLYLYKNPIFKILIKNIRINFMKLFANYIFHLLANRMPSKVD